MSDAQKKAIDFERRGIDMYLRNAGETGNPLARNLFYSLAKDEIDHISYIEELDVEPGLVADIEGDIREVYERLGEKRLGHEADNVDGLKRAMELEKEGRSLYSGLRDEATNREEEDFYTLMIRMEEKHLASLLNVYNYLTDTGEWFHSEESTVWNWMNI